MRASRAENSKAGLYQDAIYANFTEAQESPQEICGENQRNGRIFENFSPV
jgi:hypothetical protein